MTALFRNPTQVSVHNSALEALICNTPSGKALDCVVRRRQDRDLARLERGAIRRNLMTLATIVAMDNREGITDQDTDLTKYVDESMPTLRERLMKSLSVDYHAVACDITMLDMLLLNPDPSMCRVYLNQTQFFTL